jgi:hypothetical protein
MGRKTATEYPMVGTAYIKYLTGLNGVSVHLQLFNYTVQE